MQKKHIITITGKPGSGKSTTAKALAKALGYTHHSGGDLMRAIGKERGLELLQVNVAAEKDTIIDELVDQRTREIGESEDNQVIDARMAWHWIPNSYKVYLDLDLDAAAERIIRNMGSTRVSNNEDIPNDPKEYAEILLKRLESEAKRYKALYDVNPYDTHNYDLVVNTATNGFDEVVKLILDSYQKWITN